MMDSRAEAIWGSCKPVLFNWHLQKFNEQTRHYESDFRVCEQHSLPKDWAVIKCEPYNYRSVSP